VRQLALLIGISALALLLSGCWNKEELDESGFVMAVAIDAGKDGRLDLTTQMYRPTIGRKGGTGESPSATANLLIKTSDYSVFEAIRDIPIYLGRKAKWSHLRIILIGEQLAKNEDIGKLIDFFFRDHEPRPSVSIMIAKGRAEKLLEKQPAIEQTIGQQLLLTKKETHRISAKSINTTLLNLALQVNSPQGDAFVSYVYEDKEDKKMLNAAGIALIKKGKMKGLLPSKKVEGLVILRDEFTSGVIQIPCQDSKRESESFEVLELDTNVKPRLADGKVTVSVLSELDGAIGELKCTVIKTKQDEKEFARKIEEQIKKQMLDTIQVLQSHQVDAIGIGNMIAGAAPRKWKSLKENWGEHFAQAEFNIRVKIKLMTTGTTIGRPVVSWEEK
jgi:germination protein, Ger(x)C family